MAKIISVYETPLNSDTNIEKCWYDSSNVIYSECIDKEGEYKKLKVVFSNGTQYLYKDVDVMDYLKFRENVSQGKALNQIIKSKQYQYEKLDNADLSAISEELTLRTNRKAFFIENKDENGFNIKTNTGEVTLHLDEKQSDEQIEFVEKILNAVNVSFKLEDK